MTRITVDEVLRARLLNLSQPLELCDESGQVLARVVPETSLVELEAWEPPIDEEELRRREQSDRWYTTKQVLEHLKNLENS